MEQISLRGESLNSPIFVIDDDAFLQFETRSRGQTHDLAMRKDMPVGADAGFTNVPIRKHVSITLPRKQMIADPPGASSKRSIGAQIVAVIHVDEESAILIK